MFCFVEGFTTKTRNNNKKSIRFKDIIIQEKQHLVLVDWVEIRFIVISIMSKLSFRARALDPSKPMPIYLAEELPDLQEYSAINRAVPQMPSGMEKEEESVSILLLLYLEDSFLSFPPIFHIHLLSVCSLGWPFSFCDNLEWSVCLFFFWW